MSYTLRFDEMLEAARASDMPFAEDWIKMAEMTSTILARTLADHLECLATDSNLDMAILGSVFSPHKPGDPIPEAIQHFDTHSEWGA